MPIASLSTHASHVNHHFWVMQDWLLQHQHTHKKHACCHYLSLIHSQQLPCPSTYSHTCPHTLYLSVSPVQAHFTYQSHLSMHTLPISLTCPCTIYLSISPVHAHFTYQSHLSKHTLPISLTCPCTLYISVSPVHAHFTYQSHLSMHTLLISLTCPCTLYISVSPVQAHFTYQSHLSMHTLHISHTCQCTLYTPVSINCQSVHINQYFCVTKPAIYLCSTLHISQYFLYDNSFPFNGHFTKPAAYLTTHIRWARVEQYLCVTRICLLLCQYTLHAPSVPAILGKKGKVGSALPDD